MPNLLWRFKTERFSVVCTAEEEYDVDLSWDETGETAEKLEEGEWQVFCAKVAVYLDGEEIGSDYLGQCIYADPCDFVKGHRDPDPLNRNCTINDSNIGHYFPDMVSNAISEARNYIRNCKLIKIRNAA